MATKFFKGNYIPPSNQLAYKTNKKGEIKYAYTTGNNTSSHANADFNGDGRDDILSVLATGNTAIQTLSAISIVSFNTDNVAPYNYIPVTYSLALPPNGFDKINLNRTYQSIGDFDGDGRVDVIMFVFKNELDQISNTYISRWNAYLYTSINNYIPKIINELILPGTSLPSNTYTNIVDPSIANLDDAVDVVNFDGDSKADLLVKHGSTSYVYSIVKNANGDYVAIVKTLNTELLNHRIYQGDFNGDTKTDLLTYDPSLPQYQAWKIHISTGKEYLSTVFNFHMPDVELVSWIGQQNSIHPKDNILITDLNGDGMSDILHGKSALISNYCNSPTYYLDVYFAKGDGTFLLKNESFANNVGECPNGNGVFPDNSFLPSDPNGDGRMELYYKGTTTGSVLSKLAFKENGQEQLLQKATDGRNNTVSFRYDLLTIGSPFHIAGNISNVTVSNLNVNYPISSIQPALYAVSSMSYPDGIGGLNTTSYSYEEALKHSVGRGFLGFKAIKAANIVQNVIAENYFIPNQNYSQLVPQYEKYFQLNTNSLLFEKSYSFAFQSYGAKLFQIRNIQELSHNVLQGYYTKNTSLNFDYWGNTLQIKNEVYKTANNNIEEEEQNTLYTTPGSASSIPSVVSQIDNNLLRSGGSMEHTQQKFTYFSSGKLKSIEEFANMPNPITTSFGYNIAGCVNSKTISANSVIPRAQLYFWDPLYRYPLKQTVTSVPSIAATTFETEFVYNPLWGKALSIKGANCVTSNQTYDAFGYLKSTQQKVGTPEAYTVNYTYGHYINGLYHSFVEVTHPGNPDKFVFYDKLGREIFASIKGFNNQDVYQLTNYNDKGIVSSETNTYLPSETPILTSYQYDDLNRLVGATNSNSSIAKSYLTTNGDMLVTSINTLTGQQNSIKYDPTGKVINSTDLGGSLTFEYDSKGNVVKTSQGNQLYTESQYDGYNRLISTTDINAGTKSYIYNAIGQLEQETDALNNVFNYKYDDAGRLADRIGAEGVQSFIYGLNGATCQKLNLTHTSNYNNVDEDYQYDDFGRLTTRSTLIDGTTQSYKYTYDPFDRITSTEFPSAFKTYNEYTIDGYLNRISYATAFNGQGQPTAYNYIYTAQEFNGMNQPMKYQLGNGYTTTKAYTNGFQTSQQASLNGNSIYNTTLSHNLPTGNVLARKDNMTQPVYTETFDYDNLDRLRNAQNSTPSNTYLIVQYDHDGGNNTSKGNLKLNSIVGNIGYGAPKVHAPGFITGIVTPIPNVQSGPDIPDTDIVSDKDQDMTYTSFNKVASITEDNKELSYLYDIRQDRIKSVLTDNNTNETTTKYYFNNYEIKITPSNQTYKMHYIQGGDGLCAIVSIDDNNGTQVHYTYNDHLGSIQTVTDATGNIEYKQSFDAWGRRRNPDDWDQLYPTLSPIAGQPEWLYRGYTGHEHVPEFGLINMNGRMYDPALGRMCSPDKYIQSPLNTQSYNRYAYCLNNPLKYTDPSGDFLFTTPQGYEIQKAISPIALNLSFDRKRRGMGYNVSVGVPKTWFFKAPRWHYGESYYKRNYFSGEGKEYRSGRELSLGYALLSINSTTYNEPGTEFDQTTTTFTTGDAFLNISHENDVWVGGINKLTNGFIPSAGGDEHRTAAIRTTAGFNTWGSNMFTGVIQRDDNGNPKINPNNSGTYVEDFPYRMSTYEAGFGPLKVGVDYDGIRHVIQNRFAHDYLTNKGATKPNPFKRTWPKRQSGSSLWFQQVDYQPRFYFNVSSGGDTLW